MEISSKCDALVFRESREELGWSCEDVAKRLGCSRVIVFYWDQGQRSVPSKVVDWISQLAALHRAFPPPVDWRQQSRVPCDGGDEGLRESNPRRSRR